MLDFLETIPAEYRPLALLIFVVGGAISAVMAHNRGRKIGPEAPKVQEFAMSGQFADMGPVKELVEQTGLLVQQQIRTNMLLEATAKAQDKAAESLRLFCETYIHRQRELEMEEEVERRIKEREGSKK